MDGIAMDGIAIESIANPNPAHIDIGEAKMLQYVGFKSTLSICSFIFCTSLFKVCNIKVKEVTAVHSTYHFKKSYF